jgi:hypothetical protein
MHPVEMNSLFGQQGSWKGTSKITMMAVFEEQKCRSVSNLEITSSPALQGSVSSFLDLVLVTAAYAAFLFSGATSWVPLLVPLLPRRRVLFVC